MSSVRVTPFKLVDATLMGKCCSYVSQFAVVSTQSLKSHVCLFTVKHNDLLKEVSSLNALTAFHCMCLAWRVWFFHLIDQCYSPLKYSIWSNGSVDCFLFMELNYRR